MMRRLSLLVGIAAFAAALAVPGAAHAQIFSKRGTAILPPAECPDGPDCYDKKGAFTPCYSPATPISVRWRTTFETPYYPGCCAKRSHGAQYGCDAAETGCAAGAGGGYGAYSGARHDEAELLHLGGLGPYSPTGVDIISELEGHHAGPR
jgi:hypothetical protein